MQWHPRLAAIFRQVIVLITPATRVQWEWLSPKCERAIVHPSERQKETLPSNMLPGLARKKKNPLFYRGLVPVCRKAGICSGTLLGADDDVQGEAVRMTSAPCQGSGEEELSGTQLNIQEGQAAQVSQEL